MQVWSLTFKKKMCTMTLFCKDLTSLCESVKWFQNKKGPAERVWTPHRPACCQSRELTSEVGASRRRDQRFAFQMYLNQLFTERMQEEARSIESDAFLSPSGKFCKVLLAARLVHWGPGAEPNYQSLLSSTGLGFFWGGAHPFIPIILHPS